MHEIPLPRHKLIRKMMVHEAKLPRYEKIRKTTVHENKLPMYELIRKTTMHENSLPVGSGSLRAASRSRNECYCYGYDGLCNITASTHTRSRGI